MRSQILTERQQEELNKAVVQYLEPFLALLDRGSDALAAVRTALGRDTTSQPEIVAHYLEKKWSTVLRLQKKIIDLEGELALLKQTMAATDGLEHLAVLKDKISWLPVTTKKLYPTEPHQIVHLVVIHPFLPQITAGCSDGSLITWNLVNDELVIPSRVSRGHTRAVNGLAWLWGPVALKSSARSGPGATSAATPVMALCLADLSVKVWDPATGNNIRTLSGHEHTVLAVVFSPSQPEILYSVSRDKTTRVWDVINGYCVRKFVGHLEWVRDIDVAAPPPSSEEHNPAEPVETYGDFVLTCSNDHSVRLSHAGLGTGVALLIGHTHVVETVRFLPLLANAHLDKYLENNIGLFPSLTPEILKDPVYKRLGFKYCVSGGRDNTVRVWLLPPPLLTPHRPPGPAKINGSQGWLIATLSDHSSWVKTLCVHPSGRFILSGSDDRTIRAWDLAALNVGGHVRCVRTLEGHQGFVNGSDFARATVEPVVPEEGEKEEATDKRKLEAVAKKMRCLFVSCGVDNLVRLWS